MLRLLYVKTVLGAGKPLTDQWDSSTNTGKLIIGSNEVVLELAGDPETSVTTTRTT